MENSKPLKKLKKVDNFKADFKKLHQNLIQAYDEKNSEKIDLSRDELFNFLDNAGLPIDNEYYIGLKNYTWQKNHSKIFGSINNQVQKLGRLPTTLEIANDVNLSTETVYKHLKNIDSNEFFKDEIEKIKLLRIKILSVLFHYGVNGNIKACTAFLEYTMKGNEIERANIQQNNFIQINNNVINQSDFEKLDEMKQNKILEIFEIKKLHQSKEAR